MAAKGKPKPRDGASLRRILIVEDHIDARLVLEEFLEAEGFATSVVKTVAEASALLAGGFSYDLVLLDLMLPGRNGLELLELIRGLPGAPGKVPVIIVSAHAPPEVEGADAVIHKPIELTALLATVKEILGKKRR